MALTDLSEIEILQGSFGLIWVVFATIIGIKIIMKAITLNRRYLITVGLTWILVATPWWGVSFQFVIYCFSDYNYYKEALLIGSTLLPLGLICWTYSFCRIFHPKLIKNFFIAILIFVAIWEIFIFVSIMVDPDLIVTMEGTFEATYTRIMLIFIIIALTIFLITGIIFSLKSMKADDLEIKWKGRFLLLAWILFAFGAIFDAAPLSIAVTLIIIRLILIVSSIFFYLGFFLPEFLKKRIVK